MRSALLRKLAWVLAAAAAVAALAAADLVLRARSAYREGEKYMQWHARPEAKKAFFETQFSREKARLDAEKAAGRMPEAEYERRLELERFRADESAAESSLKYAYHWFKTGSELFAPPESRWTKLSRARKEEALALWKKELDARKIPYEPAMFE
ncbi:MAG TPA: hypothetical protein DCM05_17320 [Elusimicrobia bacterium]|nr:hypothetical protein [Elusimicrobiota bacterium]